MILEKRVLLSLDSETWSALEKRLDGKSIPSYIKELILVDVYSNSELKEKDDENS